MGDAKTVLTIREWPVDLHRQMRSKAAAQGITLRELRELFYFPSLTGGRIKSAQKKIKHWTHVLVIM